MLKNKYSFLYIITYFIFLNERVSMSVNFDDRLDLEAALKSNGERGPK